MSDAYMPQDPRERTAILQKDAERDIKRLKDLIKQYNKALGTNAWSKADSINKEMSDLYQRIPAQFVDKDDELKKAIRSYPSIFERYADNASDPPTRREIPGNEAIFIRKPPEVPNIPGPEPPNIRRPKPPEVPNTPTPKPPEVPNTPNTPNAPIDDQRALNTERLARMADRLNNRRWFRSSTGMTFGAHAIGQQQRASSERHEPITTEDMRQQNENRSLRTATNLMERQRQAYERQRESQLYWDVNQYNNLERVKLAYMTQLQKDIAAYAAITIPASKLNNLLNMMTSGATWAQVYLSASALFPDAQIPNNLQSLLGNAFNDLNRFKDFQVSPSTPSTETPYGPRAG